jgi:hypothetical protein
MQPPIEHTIRYFLIHWRDWCQNEKVMVGDKGLEPLTSPV